MTQAVKLGLIGDNIHSSSAPLLHKMAAAQYGIDLSYDLIIPPKRGLDFDGALHFAVQAGLRGVNVTLPYKEQAFRRVNIADPAVQQLGAVNTICFDTNNLNGFNTDYTGFVKSYRAARGDLPVGNVLLIGAGGVGRSVSFALAKLGATALYIFDKDFDRAVMLANEVNQLPTKVAVATEGIDTLAFDAIVNCSPAGMHGYGGLPLPETQISKKLSWAFDAVYQPVETPFQQLVTSLGVQFISGFELFFHQGVDAFFIFTGLSVKDEESLRETLSKSIIDKGKSTIDTSISR
ncbi:MAG: shikimate dehydrogenase [Alphaproteobacteria bacterium]